MKTQGWKEILRRVLLSPQERLRENQDKLARRIRDEPKELAEEGRKRAALRYFLRCFREEKPEFLRKLRELVPDPLDLMELRSVRDLCNRYYLPPTADDECIRTRSTWQFFPDVDLWHFECPEGRISSVSDVPPVRPYPFLFQATGWNPETETLKAAKERLEKHFGLALKRHSEIWELMEVAHSELRHFESTERPETLRYLQCLAEKQASPGLSDPQLAERLSLSKEAVRVGLRAAADLIGLSEIRKAPPGAPKGKPHRRRK